MNMGLLNYKNFVMAMGCFEQPRRNAYFSFFIQFASLACATFFPSEALRNNYLEYG